MAEQSQAVEDFRTRMSDQLNLAQDNTRKVLERGRQTSSEAIDKFRLANATLMEEAKQASNERILLLKELNETQAALTKFREE